MLSCFALLSSVEAARRPRYGGSLRVEMHESLSNLDPADVPADANEAAAKAELTRHVFETLVQFDAHGDARPMLATSWTHDAARKRWVFNVRPDVVLQNGENWVPPGGVITVDDRRPIDDILRTLSKPQNAVVVRTSEGALVGTGPFRITKWEPNQTLTLEAHDRYWAGRPFLDEVQVRFGRSLRDQSLDLDLGKADVVQIGLSDVKRTRQRGGRVVLSPPVEVLALAMDNPRPELEHVREALSLSIDRVAIHSVLLQKNGEISGALLPQWLSGYAFLFDHPRDITRAKELAAGAPPLTFAYEQKNPLLRAIAERIVLNAGEAGIVLRPPTDAPADLRLISLRIGATDPAQALEDLASALQSPPLVAVGQDPANLYAMENALISVRRLTPLFQLPLAYELGPGVHDWSAGRWRFENVWIEGGAP